MYLLLSRFITRLVCILTLLTGLTLIASNAFCYDLQPARASKAPIWNSDQPGKVTQFETGLATDGLYAQFRGPESITGAENDAGIMTYINGLMPLEFMLYIKPQWGELSLYGGGDSRNITDVLRASTQYINGYPRYHGVDLEVFSIRIPERYTDGWAGTLAKKEPVILRYEDKEIAYLRLRIRFKVDIKNWLAVQPQNIPKKLTNIGRRYSGLPLQPLVSIDRPATFAMRIYADFGDIDGNEDTQDGVYKLPLDFLDRVFKPVLFQVVEWDKTNEGLVMDYYSWRLRVIKNRTSGRSERDKQRAIIQTYKDALRDRPDSESLILDYARELEFMGRYDQEIKVLSRLIKAIQKVPRDKYFIYEIEYSYPHLQMIDGRERRKDSPEQLVKVLNHHIARLRQKIKDESKK